MRNESVFNYTTPEGERKSFRVLGHMLLVRRCERDENEFLVGEASHELEGQARLMVETMTKRGWCHWCHVLAIGEDARKPRTEEQMAKFKVNHPSPLVRREEYCIPLGVDITGLQTGDFVVVPEVSETNTQWRGVTGHEYDCLTDVTNVIAWLPEERTDVPKST